jgi:hypothetical protein
MRWGVVAALGAAIVVAGCASITRGTSEPVVFDSEPAGAEMRSTIVNKCAEPGACPGSGDARDAMIDRSIKAGPACITPCTVQIPRSQELIVTFSKSGFEPRTVKLTTGVRPGGAAGVVGNAIAGGIIGVAVDAGTGAGLDHCPNPLKVTLRRAGSREPEARFDQRCAPPPISAEGMPAYATVGEGQ